MLSLVSSWADPRRQNLVLITLTLHSIVPVRCVLSQGAHPRPRPKLVTLTLEHRALSAYPCSWRSKHSHFPAFQHRVRDVCPRSRVGPSLARGLTPAIVTALRLLLLGLVTFCHPYSAVGLVFQDVCSRPRFGSTPDPDSKASTLKYRIFACAMCGLGLGLGSSLSDPNVSNTMHHNISCMMCMPLVPFWALTQAEVCTFQFSRVRSSRPWRVLVLCLGPTQAKAYAC